MTTLFAKIIKGEIPCEKVYENEHVFALKDIAPKAPVHILILPKKEYRDLQSLPPDEAGITLTEVLKAAQYLAEEYGITDGYRLLTNNGPGSGQTIFHLHFHLIGGKQLSDELA